jgi:phage terminase large subunit-like protein
MTAPSTRYLTMFWTWSRQRRERPSDQAGRGTTRNGKGGASDSREPIQAVSPDGRRRLLAHLKANVEAYDATHRYERMFPDTGPLRRSRYARHLAFFAASEKYVETAILGANRSGKSTTAAYALVAHLTGAYAPWWPGRKFGAPIVAWACGNDSRTVRETIQTILFGADGAPGTGMIPGDAIVSTVARAGSPGSIDAAQIRHVSGGISRLLFKGYDQRRLAFVGAKCQVIWLDEECDAGIYSECLARLTATTPGERSGLLMATYTPLLGLSEQTLPFLPGGRPPETPLT